VVDNHDKKCDAEPLKSKNSDVVLKAFKKIYSRGILSLPKIQIEVDNGAEFKGEVSDYFEKHNVRVRVAETGRHRQQALVESRNKLIGSILLQLQTLEELKTDETNTKWVDILPDVIEEMNQILPKPIKKQISDEPITTKYNKDLLPIGEKVRIALNHPIDVATNKRLSGKFRESDIRFEKKAHVIENIILKPGFPPLYKVDHVNSALTKNEIIKFI
jgi:hypothetical protein